MRRLERQPGEHDATTLTIGQLLDRTDLLSAGQTVSAHDSAHLLDLLHFWEALHHVLQCGQLEVELLVQMLMVSGDLQVTVRSDQSLLRYQLSGQQLEKSGFACLREEEFTRLVVGNILVGYEFGLNQFPANTKKNKSLTGTVRADQRQPGVQIDTELQIAIDPRRIVAVPERDVLHHDHRRWQFAARREVERNRLLLHHLVGQTAGDHFGQRLLFTLRLSGQLGATVTESGDVLLHVRDLRLLPVVAFHLVLEQLESRLHELVVVTGVVLELLVGEVDDVCTDVVHEVLRV